MLNFKIPRKKYNIKIIDSLSFLQGNLDSLSKDLDDNLKIVTKEHFKNNFEMMNKKLNKKYDFTFDFYHILVAPSSPSWLKQHIAPTLSTNIPIK